VVNYSDLCFLDFKFGSVWILQEYLLCKILHKDMKNLYIVDIGESLFKSDKFWKKIGQNSAFLVGTTEL
jgi:hypothetical protein